MAGKLIREVLEAQHRGRNPNRKKEGNSQQSINKYPIDLKGPDRCTYTAYMDTPLPTFPDSKMNHKDKVPSVPADALEYGGWIALDNELYSSVNWNQQARSVDSEIY